MRRDHGTQLDKNDHLVLLTIPSEHLQNPPQFFPNLAVSFTTANKGGDQEYLQVWNLGHPCRQLERLTMSPASSHPPTIFTLRVRALRPVLEVQFRSFFPSVTPTR
jgi:hypothetical protein